MTATFTEMGASPLARIVDEQQVGSAGGQATIGVAGIVLAVILVLGQVSLATTKGIAAHLHASVEHIREGNEVMESVIERSAPTVQLEKALAQQSRTLASTRDAMVATNTEMTEIEKTTGSLAKVVGGMQATSSDLATGVAGVDSSTSSMTEMLGSLPGATTRTQTQLSRINADTAAINGELEAIAAKMLRYGLPRAMGAPTG